MRVGSRGAGFQQRFRESNYRRLSKKNTLEKGKGKRGGNRVGAEEGEEGREEDIQVFWPGTWYMFFRSTSQAYIILISLLYLFLFCPSSISFLTTPSWFFIFFLNIKLSYLSNSIWITGSGCQAACIYSHIV